MLSETPSLSPVYFIVGGVKPFEGCIITRSLNKTESVVKMDPNSPSGWYIRNYKLMGLRFYANLHL